MSRLQAWLAGALVCVALALGIDSRAQEPPRPGPTVGQASAIAVSPPVTISGTSTTNVLQTLQKLRDRDVTDMTSDGASGAGECPISDGLGGMAWASCGSGSGHTIKDEGSTQTGATIDFVGSGVTAVGSAGTITVTIPGGGGTGDVNGGSTSTADDIAVYSATGGKTLGNSASGIVRLRPHATLGSGIRLTEGADDGTATWTLKAPDTGLTGNTAYSFDLTAGGQIPAAAVVQDITLDTAPVFGANVDFGGFNAINMGALTVGTLTYDTAISTCTGLGCGSQLPLVAGTPSDADSGTLRVYNDDDVLAIYGDSTQHLIGNVVYTAGTTVADNEVARTDGTTGEKVQGTTGVTLSDAGVLDGLTQVRGTSAVFSRMSNYVMTNESACLTPGTTDYSLCQVGGLLQALDSSAVAHYVPYAAIAPAAGAIVRYTASGSPNITGAATATIDASGNIVTSGTLGAGVTTLTSATSATGSLLIGATSTAGGGIKMPEKTANGTGFISIKVTATTNLTDGTNTVIAAEHIATVSTGADAAHKYGAPVYAISDGSAIDTGTELCALQFGVNGISATCQANSVADFGAAGTNSVVVQDCGTGVTSGHVFQALCTVSP